RWHELLLTFASQNLDRLDQMKLTLRMATDTSFEPSDRARAMVLLKRAGLNDVWRTIGPDEFRSAWVTRSDGIPLRAADFLSGELDEAGFVELDKRIPVPTDVAFDLIAPRFPWARPVRAELLNRAENHEAAHVHG